MNFPEGSPERDKFSFDVVSLTVTETASKRKKYLKKPIHNQRRPQCRNVKIAAIISNSDELSSWWRASRTSTAFLQRLHYRNTKSNPDQ